MWNVRTENVNVPVKMGVLGTIKKRLDQKLQLLPSHLSAMELYKITLMSTLHNNGAVLG
jgi:hypothetical protein